MRINPCLVAITLALAAAPAHACPMYLPQQLADVRYAQTVVVGRITDYRLVLDPGARRRWREHVALQRRRDPNYVDTIKPSGFITDYARFTIIVDALLSGRAGRRIDVTWDASTFSEPEQMAPGQYLIALRDPRGSLPPLRGPSGYVAPGPGPKAPTVLQAPCSGAFIFPAGSADAARVRALLRRPQSRTIR
ncbi:hypothetical protein [Sphingomonas sp.]|jgi:hypothetical protein|uniref:hypothetical protein n=1 Tax=Sphingomonas sp. TaxID=28214 RepID=UPI002D7E8B1B|nr:hypothetical protein [Sphingomonas sp.]HEU0043290.1 hypothetical protein [Sphingomonas sp.]